MFADIAVSNNKENNPKEQKNKQKHY